MDGLRVDGERFLPDQMDGLTALEHLHRYSFALQFALGRRVLDIACGEGYGTASIASVAAHTIGVDIDPAAIEHAANKYRHDGVEFRLGECANVPVENHAVDLVVSFETLEHHDQHDAMMVEIKRVLSPTGLVLISTPDKREYSERTGLRNPFHVKELYREEFEALLRKHFKQVVLMRQRVVAGSWLLHDASDLALEFFPEHGATPSSTLPAAPYLLALASDVELPAARGGLLEKDLAQLAAPMLRDTFRQLTSLLKEIALPGSPLLREHLNRPWYLNQNPDLTAADFNRYDHWMDNGAAECRLPTADPVALARELVAERLGARAAGLGSGMSSDLATALADRWQQTQAEQLAAAARLEGMVSQTLDAWRASLNDSIASAQVAFQSLNQDMGERLADVACGLRAEWTALWNQIDRRLQSADAAEKSQIAKEQAHQQAQVQWQQLYRDAANASEQRLATVQAAALQTAVDVNSQWQTRLGQLEELLRQARLEEQQGREREEQLRSEITALARAHRDELARQTAKWHELDQLHAAHMEQTLLDGDQRLRELLAVRDEREWALQQSLNGSFAKLAEFMHASSIERVSMNQAAAAQAAQYEQLTQDLARLQGSRSWRWTAPVRRLAQALHRSRTSATPSRSG